MGKKNKSKKQNKEDRFAAAETRPQFRSLKTTESKVVLDERFSSVLTDPRFQLEGKDKYGRGKKKQAVKEELSAFYTIEEKDDTKKQVETDTDEESTEQSPVNNDETDDPKVVEDPASRIAYLTAFSRGEIEVSSSSEDDDSSRSSENDDNDEDDDDEDPVHGKAGVLDPSNKDEEVEITYDDSPYLVATNLDWENIRAMDIFAIVSSFAPPGAVKKVQVYQSDFGMERMAKDKLVGPTDIWKRKKVKKQSKSNDSDDEEGISTQGESEEEEDDDNSEGSIDEGSAENESDSENDNPALDPEESNGYDESDFDPEKLRAYEASKLKYYFAIIEFSKPEYADVAYKEVDGMEFEHSSSAIDLRALPPEALDDVVKDRPMRDEASSVPSNYDPPDFIVGALQQTKVQCTWDQGDVEREKKLTKYGTGEWQNLSEADELKAYLASDVSSDDESDDEKGAKGANLRKLLGLDSGDESDKSAHSRGDSSNDDSDSEQEGEKTLKFVPETKNLEQKIRNKLEATEDATTELTPWQKYQEKRKQKRKERKQAAKTRGATESGIKTNQTHDTDNESDDEDDFFMESKKTTKSKNEVKEKTKPAQSSNHELELLLAGENEVEEARDYDIRGIQRMEKNKDKKLRGTRKRKEDKITEDVSGKDFKVNVEDKRFAAVLDGSDDRFGIDKTDPNYKETSGMREILSEQTKRRKKKRKTQQQGDSFVTVPDVGIEENAKSAGASALSALVQKIKTQVSAR